MILVKSYNLVFTALAAVTCLFSGCKQPAVLALDPIAVYLTWQRSPDTTMTVQWIAPPSENETKVEYRLEGEDLWLETAGKHHPLPQDHEEQHVHVVELTDLSPDTIYQFRIAGKQREYKFRTMPSHLEGSIRFVIGGDMYHETVDILQTANERAAKTNPHFGVAGGDLAYASTRLVNGTEDYVRWMEFIHRWSEDMVTEDGLMIPILAVIGNHDVNGRYGQPIDSAKFYYSMFTMPKGYNVLDFGDYLSLIMLDTDHTHPVDGEQAEWLHSTLAERQSFPHKIAAYHVPAWPSVRNFNGKHNPLIREKWVPLFEEFGVNLCFEHHEHAFKRTHPIKQGKIDPTGVVYVGDGAWGCTPRAPHTPEERWYLAKSRQAQHVLVVDISPEGREVTAIDVPTGQVIDQFQQTLEPALAH
ncbi:MAG: metallophosphoesterase family protein [Chlamydiales bacterium]|nr:metallophosphoesterase family protein [Chlamydiales bacterium]